MGQSLEFNKVPQIFMRERESKRGVGSKKEGRLRWAVVGSSPTLNTYLSRQKEVLRLN